MSKLRDDSVIPDGIRREHVITAIEDFQTNGFPEGYSRSHTYELVHETAVFAPPAILALAIKAKTGLVPTTKFRAGENTKCFDILRTCGFEIRRIKKG
jgi:hypothetical protein